MKPIKIKNYLLPLTLMISITTNVFAERESGGGYFIKCPHSKPLTLDYYQSTLLSPGEYKRNEQTGTNLFLYSEEELSTLDLHKLFFEYIKTFKKPVHYITEINDREVSPKKIKKLLSKLKTSKRKVGGIDQWEEVNFIGKKNADANAFLPGVSGNCSVFQGAKSFKGGKVQILKRVKNNLSPVQKDLIELHEKVYSVGYQYYGHESSFLTRNLLSNFLKSIMISEDKITIASPNLRELEDLYLFVYNQDSKASKFYQRFQPLLNSRYRELDPVISPISFFGYYEFEENEPNNQNLEGKNLRENEETLDCPLHFKILKAKKTRKILETNLFSPSESRDAYIGTASSFSYPFSINYGLDWEIETPEFWDYQKGSFSLILGKGPDFQEFHYKLTHLQADQFVLEKYFKLQRLSEQTKNFHKRVKITSCLYQRR